MSTTGLTTWATDLKDIAAVYPFQGWEVLMVIAAFVFWILWHIVQLRQESAEYREDRRSHFNSTNVGDSVDRY